MPATACLQCGTPAASATSTFCRRCGLPYGAPPRADAELPSCHVCYQSVDDDGRLPSKDLPGLRVDLQNHLAEHERHPVGDDEWLESLRQGDRIRVGRWTASFDVVRYEHDAIVTAMTQLKRWGPGGEIFGDQPGWAAARDAVAELMERYHRRP
jgi:hypothetical protein